MPEIVTPEQAAQFLSVEEFAAQHGMTRDAIWKWVRRHNLPHVKVGRRIMIPADALARMESRQSVSTTVSTN